MQENYREFPSFVTAGNMRMVTSDTDNRLCKMRKLITQNLIDASTSHTNYINIHIHTPHNSRLNYMQIKILNDELTKRGFRLGYILAQINSLECAVTKLGVGKSSAEHSFINCNFNDININGDMPQQMIISWGDIHNESN